MSWFNWPPDPTPTPLAYFREHKLRAQQIDPGIALALEIYHEEKIKFVQEAMAQGSIRAYSFGFRTSGRNCTIRQLGTSRNESDDTGSANDSGFSWLFSDGRWNIWSTN